MLDLPTPHETSQDLFEGFFTPLDQNSLNAILSSEAGTPFVQPVKQQDPSYEVSRLIARGGLFNQFGPSRIIDERALNLNTEEGFKISFLIRVVHDRSISLTTSTGGFVFIEFPNGVKIYYTVRQSRNRITLTPFGLHPESAPLEFEEYSEDYYMYSTKGEPKEYNPPGWVKEHYLNHGKAFFESPAVSKPDELLEELTRREGEVLGEGTY